MKSTFIKIQTTITLFVLTFLLQSCQETVSKTEYDKAIGEIEILKMEIDDCKYGADKLLKKSKNLISKKDYEAAKSVLTDMIFKYPDSDESVEGKILLIEVDKGIEAKKIKIEKEKKAKEEAEKRRLAEATMKVRKSYDDMAEITWYNAYSTKKSYKSRIYAYIGVRDNGRPWLRLVIRYYGDDWLFIESYQIKVDGKSYIIEENERNEISRDNSGGSVWETLDRNVDAQSIKIISALIYGESAKMRYRGSGGIKDRVITSSEKQGLKDVLDAYEALGGDMDFK